MKGLFHKETNIISLSCLYYKKYLSLFLGEFKYILMKNLATFASILIILTSGVLWNLSYFEISIGILAIASFLMLLDVTKYTRTFQFVTHFAVAFFVAGLVAISSSNAYFFSTAILIFAFTTVSRLLFIKTFSYANKKFFETSLTSVGVVIGSVPFFLNEDVNIYFAIPMFATCLLSMIISFNVVNGAKQLNTGKQGNPESIIGKAAPEFELEDQNGEITTLAQFKNDRHLLLIFVRGDWCPYCHMILRTYFKNKEKFATKDVMVMAIGPDPVGVNREMVEKLGLDYKVLSDDHLKTASKYGIQLPEFSQPGATVHEEGMPLPASFLIDKQGIIRYTSSSSKVGEFLDPSLIFPILEKLDN